MSNKMHLSDKEKYEINLLWNTFYLMRDHFIYSELEEIVELGNDLIQDKKETGNTDREEDEPMDEETIKLWQVRNNLQLLYGNSDFEFYAELNGKKIAGFSGLQSQVSGIAGDLVQGNVNMQLSGHSSVAVYLTHEEMYNAKFYVETPGNKRELRLSEVY